MSAVNAIEKTEIELLTKGTIIGFMFDQYLRH